MTDLKKMYRTLQEDPFPDEMTVKLGDCEVKFQKRAWTVAGEEKGLRYGENPDQPAALYYPVSGELEIGGVAFRGPKQGLVSALTEEHMLQAGKHPGKINLTDVDNGLNILQCTTAKPTAVILKHNNPCGAAWSDDGPASALERAFAADRIAAFGGTVVINRSMDKACAEIVDSSYFEVVAAPQYEPGVLDILQRKKNLRILLVPGMAELESFADMPFLDVKSLIDGGLIAQFSFRNSIRSADDFLPAEATGKDGQSVAARKPEPREADDLLFAWAVESGVTSNSVIFVKDGATVAIGTGEQDRVGCVESTIRKAYTKYADLLCFKERSLSLYELQQRAKTSADEAAALTDIMARTEAAKGGLPGSVLASDGFFPFRDGVDLALEQGVTAIIQPGGSIRDFEVIQAANEASPQAAMAFTGRRSFKH